MAGTEALRVETEEANDARRESFRPRVIPERFLSRGAADQLYGMLVRVKKEMGCANMDKDSLGE